MFGLGHLLLSTGMRTILNSMGSVCGDFMKTFQSYSWGLSNSPQFLLLFQVQIEFKVQEGTQSK